MTQLLARIAITAITATFFLSCFPKEDPAKSNTESDYYED